MSDRNTAMESSSRRRRDTGRLRTKRDTKRYTAEALRPWRVLVVGPAPDLSGLSLYTRILMQSLRSQGDEVLYIAPKAALSELLIESADEYFQLPQDSLGFFAGRELDKHVAEFEPEMVHCVWPSADLPVARCKKIGNCPAVLSVLGIKEGELPTSRSTDYEGFIASDQSVRERLLNDCGISRDVVSLVGDAAFALPETRKNLPEHRPVVAWVGPLLEGGDAHSFIDAAAMVPTGSSGAMFAMLGTGSYAEVIREQLENRGLLQRIVVIEKLFSYSDFWQPFDVAVVDSHQPAAAIVVLSAMAAGLPVIATEGGAVFEVIEDGVDGMIVPRNDPATMSERILMLVDNPDEMQRMGGAARAKIEAKFKPEHMGKALHSVYYAIRNQERLPRSFE
ncbi:MAG: glycosyltransferase family 4 protein [Planctomycetes bacterium]|nr:glycosyltransferase family 4 protein [Planctomycetota bacterium]